HVIAETRERFGDVGANIGVVLDHQDAFVRSPGGLLRPRLFCRGRVAGKTAQVDLDRRAFADLAVDLQVPAGLLDETIDLAEAEPGAVTGSLGGEERLEGALDYIF